MQTCMATWLCEKMVALRPKMRMNSCKSGRTQVAAHSWPLASSPQHPGFLGGRKVKIPTPFPQPSWSPPQCYVGGNHRLPGLLSYLLVQLEESARPQIRASRAEDRDKANKKGWVPSRLDMKVSGQTQSTRGILPQPRLHAHLYTHPRRPVDTVKCPYRVPHMHPGPMVDPGDKAWVQMQKRLWSHAEDPEATIRTHPHPQVLYPIHTCTHTYFFTLPHKAPEIRPKAHSVSR